MTIGCSRPAPPAAEPGVSMVQTAPQIASHVAATGMSPALVALLVVLGAVEVGLLAWALVDLYRRPSAQVNGGSKIPWLILCLLLQFIGPIVYLAVGRERAKPARDPLAGGAAAGGAAAAGAVPPPLAVQRADAAAVVDSLFAGAAGRGAGPARRLRPRRGAARRAQDLRRRASRWTASRSACRPAPSTGSSAPTGPARRRPCASSPGSRTPTPARPDARSRRRRRRRRRARASSASSPTCRPSTSG